MIYCGKSDIGNKRDTNEDCFGSYVDDENNLSFFILADGMGGHNAGEVASLMAVEQFLNEAKRYKGSKTKKVIRSFALRTLKEINGLIYSSSLENSSNNGMGTTSVLCIVTSTYITVANVGDSRAYLISKEEKKQLTIDHSYIEDLIRNGYLDRDFAKDHPGRHVITRALGVTSDIDVDTFEFPYKQGDILIMCSDGLNSMVTDEVIYKIADGYDSPELICDHLIDEAKKNGGNDNITIIVVML